MEGTLENFKKEVIEAKGLVAVDFYRDFCPGCLSAQKRLGKINQPLKIVRVNVEKEKEITRAFQIESVPAILFFKDGHLLQDITPFFHA